MPYQQNNQTNKRKQYAPQFKFDRAIETIKKDSLSEWRADLIERGYRVFETNQDQEVGGLRKQIARLEQMVGKKEVELNLLKNFSDFYESRSSP